MGGATQPLTAQRRGFPAQDTACPGREVGAAALGEDKKRRRVASAAEKQSRAAKGQSDTPLLAQRTRVDVSEFTLLPSAAVHSGGKQ